ncbi:MAG: hypothetical protein HYZ15_08940 [Sphingobacteriales bacterium]|nr:hypothetical protein [Sphingobacteriales bacterium]
MNAAQIHLALNHAPLFLSVIGGGLLVLGMIKKNELLKTLSLYMLVAAAVFTAPVFLTGEGTEELVEKAAGVTDSAIESHEEMAKISLVVIILTGVMALTGLFTRKKEALSRIVLMAVVLLSLASFGSMAQTAHLGGLIRHTELQNGQATGGEQQNNNDKDDEKEDD